jgi:hypothetical protein
VAEDEDRAERHEGEVEDTAAIKAVVVLEPSSPDEAGLLYECLSMVRQRYVATAINGQPRQKPSVAKRKLENIGCTLNRHRLPRRRALANSGAKYFLRLAGVRHFDNGIQLKKLEEIDKPRALKIFREKLDEENKENFGQLRYLITKEPVAEFERKLPCIKI